MKSKRQNNSRLMNAAEYEWSLFRIAIIVSLIIGPSLGIGVWKLFSAMDSSTLLWLSGAITMMVAVLVVTGCWSLVVVSYSRLRSREDAGDDARELDIMKTILSMTQGQNSVNLTLPGGDTSQHSKGPDAEWVEEIPLVDYRSDLDLG